MVEKSWYNNGIVVVMWWNNNGFSRKNKETVAERYDEHCENDHGSTMVCNPGIYGETLVARQQIF
jgi:hypothetical protein